MTDLMTPVAIAAYPVVKKALDGLAPTIRRGAGAIAKNLIDKAIANFQIGFAPYLHTSYERCRSVKTLLSQDRPLALLDIYVHLLLDCKDHHVTDDGLIEDLATYRRVVITGLAGCGKSMFMKYLTICRFENPRGMIPLFVELRQLNSLTSKNLLSYIHQSCASGSKSVTYDQFELALRAGGLLLILDGFDEIDFAHRDAISEQILNVSINYPQVPVVLSSRPDEKFASWQDFYTFTIGALSKVQVLELIDKINYDEELKGRFKREVDRHLYEAHKSFLSSPLLSSIMLLTYEQFAEIPNKIHIFYEQAFAALFRRHDAQKSQFIRKTYANLAIDDFRAFFSAFCAFSYLEERFSFLEKELGDLTMKALKYVGIAAKVVDVLRDLSECLCMLQRDGLYTVFVHRSFQEYFSATFVSTYHGPQLRPMLDRFARRSEDVVFPMLFEMARDRVDREWAIPHIDDITSELGDVVDDEVSARIFCRMVTNTRLEVKWSKSRGVTSAAPSGSFGDYYSKFGLMFKLYGSTLDHDDNQYNLFDIIVRRCLRESVQRVLKREIGRSFDAKQVEEALGVFGVPQKEAGQREHSWIVEVQMTPQIAARLELSTPVGEFVHVLRLIKKAIERRIGSQDSMVEILCREADTFPKPRPRQRRTEKASSLKRAEPL